MSCKVKNKKLILMDRDGVLNKRQDNGYISSLDTFELLPGTIEFLRLIDAETTKVVIVTNQQGIAKGLMSFSDFFSIQGWFFDFCKGAGIEPPHLFYCPHLEGTCKCRKPKTGMLQAALRTFEIAADDALLLGDSKTDIEAADSLGIDSIHIDSQDPGRCSCNAICHVADLIEVIDLFTSV